MTNSELPFVAMLTDDSTNHGLVSMEGSPFDFSTPTPVERIALADTLHDSAIQEIDAMTPKLSAEQMAEIDRRIADVMSGRVALVDWDQFYNELAQGQ